MDFLSLARGGKFDDAKQPGIGWAAYPYTGPERVRVHARKLKLATARGAALRIHQLLRRARPKHKPVTCQRWDKDTKGAKTTADGRRRLNALVWTTPDED